MNINDAIPLDELNWCPEDNKFILLTDEEIQKVCLAVGLDDDEACFRAVRWAELCRTGHLLLKGVLEGRIGIHVSEDEDVKLFPLKGEKNE